MFDIVAAAQAEYDRAFAALEELNERVQAAPNYSAVSPLAGEVQAAEERIRLATRQLERQTALRSARRRIPPLNSDDEKGFEMTNVNVRGASARCMKSEMTYRPDLRGVSFVRDLLAVGLPGQFDQRDVAAASERLQTNQQEAMYYLGLTEQRDVTTADPGAGAALSIAAGAHPKLIAARLGHSSITITLDRYGHLFPSVEEALAEALNAAFAGDPVTSNITPLART